MNDENHLIDDPLDVVNVKPDFSGLGMEPERTDIEQGHTDEGLAAAYRGCFFTAIGLLALAIIAIIVLSTQR